MSRGLRVLVVDDDPVVLNVTRAILQKQGHEVLTRSEAIGTTAEILQTRPHVVLLDVEMPGLQGDRLVTLIRERRIVVEDAEVAVILHSGARAQDLEQLVKSTGALGGIEKTPDPARFLGAFQQLTRHL